MYTDCDIQEMVFALVIQLMGVMLYGYCLGAIAASLTNVVGSRYKIEHSTVGGNYESESVWFE